MTILPDPEAGDMNPGDEVPPESPSSGESVCPQCGGKGTNAEGQGKCQNCGGTGKVTQGIGGA